MMAPRSGVFHSDSVSILLSLSAMGLLRFIRFSHRHRGYAGPRCNDRGEQAHPGTHSFLKSLSLKRNFLLSSSMRFRWAAISSPTFFARSLATVRLTDVSRLL